MANRLLSYDQPEFKDMECWQQYFDWKIKSTNYGREYDTAFMAFLRISLSRPRDIQRILKILQDLMKRKNLGDKSTFDVDVYLSNEFQNAYSEYFLSSLKDQLAFYYTEEDYKFFTKFFDYFPKARFTYREYLEIYEKYTDYILSSANEIPKFVEDPKAFLQMLYDSNVIAATEDDGAFFHFSYREKSPTNISPEVPFDEKTTYRFHYGLYKKAKFGRF